MLSGTDLKKSRHVLKSLSLCNKVLSYLISLSLTHSLTHSLPPSLPLSLFPSPLSPSSLPAPPTPVCLRMYSMPQNTMRRPCTQSARQCLQPPGTLVWVTASVPAFVPWSMAGQIDRCLVHTDHLMDRTRLSSSLVLPCLFSIWGQRGPVCRAATYAF